DFRPQTWMDTLDMIREKPLTGYGPAAYRYAYPEFRKRWGGQRMVTGHPHNEYLELTADFGLIGFLLFAAAWLYGSIWMLVRSLKTEETRHAFMGFAFLGTVTGTMVHSFFDFQMHVFPNAMIFALLAAVAAGPLKRSLSTSKAKNPGRGIMNVLQPALLTAVFVFVLAIGVPLMASSAMSAVADQQAERKSTEAFNSASALYRKALKTAPDNWQAYSGMGRVLHHERRHRLEPDQKVQLAREEMEWFRQSLEYNPKDPEALTAYGRVSLFLSRFGIDRGSEEAAELEKRGLDSLRTACRYRKFNDLYWSILGMELRKTGLYAEALDAFRHMETVKRTQTSRKNIQWLEKQLNRPAEQSASIEPLAPAERPNFEGFGDTTAPKEQSLDQLFDLMGNE
uniref:O-antigen ligase family protein n=1 Tax=Pontiella sp. TaxID=2837462 RepID=UPI003569AC15